jgi:hypothetical protein
MGGPLDLSGLNLRLWELIFTGVLFGIPSGFIYGLIISKYLGSRKISSFTLRRRVIVGFSIFILYIWAFWFLIFFLGIDILFFLIGVALGILLRNKMHDILQLIKNFYQQERKTE